MIWFAPKLLKIGIEKVNLQILFLNARQAGQEHLLMLLLNKRFTLPCLI
jgi:hypothetical protein